MPPSGVLLAVRPRVPLSPCLEASSVPDGAAPEAQYRISSFHAFSPHWLTVRLSDVILIAKISVQDAAAVGEGECGGGLLDERDAGADRQRTFGEPIAQVAAVEPLHRQEALSIG